MASLAMAKYEVTFEAYDQFVKLTGQRRPKDEGWGRGKRPVIDVSWEDAQAYVTWLSRATRKPYRLPTEAEWEYAAGSGNKQETWAGTSEENHLGIYAVFSRNVGGKTAEVGSKQPNAFGLYDMSGNVWEWVEDCWHENYDGAPTDGSAWLEADGSECARRVIRGGSWGSAPGGLRSSNRFWDNSDDRNSDIGLRLAQGTR